MYLSPKARQRFKHLIVGMIVCPLMAGLFTQLYMMGWLKSISLSLPFFIGGGIFLLDVFWIILLRFLTKGKFLTHLLGSVSFTLGASVLLENAKWLQADPWEIWLALAVFIFLAVYATLEDSFR